MSFDEQQKHFGPQKHFRNEGDNQEETPDVEGHIRMGHKRADEDDDDTPDVEGHIRMGHK